MSEVNVKSELAEVDEENGRTTPKRISIYDYEVAMSTEHQVSNAEVTLPTPSTEDSSNADQQQNSDTINDLAIEALLSSAMSTTEVLVKDEPQDTDIAVSEIPVCGHGSQTTTIKNEFEENPTPTSPIIPTSPLQLPPVTDLSIETDTQTLATNSDGSPTITAEFELKSEVEDATNKPDTSNSAAKSVSENTTTPPRSQISLVPTHRLRVKSEFCETAAPNNQEYTVLPQDFFDDLLPTIAPIKDEPIPDNFFDDLLVDRVKQRVEEAETVELEEKFSDRLKLLRELDNKQRTKDKKKHKKSKKKSRKRSRSNSRDRDSRSPTPRRNKRGREDMPSTSKRTRSKSRSRSRGRDSRSPPLNYVRNRGVREDISNLPSTSNRARSNKTSDIKPSDMSDDDEPRRRLTSAADVELLDETENSVAKQPHLPEIGSHLTAKQKRDRIMIRAKALISYLKRVENSDEKPLSTFLHTSTVRKLPASYSYRSQHIYENRSPLHTINNVSYKFNSHRSQFNFEEWGLDSLPPVSAKISKLIGFDATAVHNKLKHIKIPAKVRNIKSDGLDEEDDELLQCRSSLFCNVTTQTDEMVEIIPPKAKGYEIGVQVKPASFEIACQTLETESPSIKLFDNSDDLPIMAIMRELNENQLMALHDFAELLMEPATNAMDMYRLRQRMLDIYKCSQLPSALATPVPTSGNSYTSNESSATQGFQQQQQQGFQQQQQQGFHQQQQQGFHQQQQHGQPALRIQSVCGADGQRFSVNDPRRNFTGHRSRGVANNSDARNSVPQSSNSLDPRNPSLFSQRTSASTVEPQRTHSYQMQQHQQQSSQPPTNNGNKFYGRGGLRR